MINIIDSVLTPPLNVGNTIAEANLTGFLALIAGAPENPHLYGSLGETSDWTWYVFHHGITLLMETRLRLAIALSQTPPSLST